MAPEKLVKYSTIVAVCLLTSAIYIHFWQPSIPSVVALNAIIIALCAPPYIAWNVLSPETKLVKPPLVAETETCDESIDEAVQERNLKLQQTCLTTLRQLEIEEQASPLVFGELLPKGCDEPRLVAETSRSICLRYAKNDSVTLVKIIRMTDEAWQDGAVNEIFISRALQQLREGGGAHRTSGFCRRKLAVFVRDHIPRQILQARQRENEVQSDLKEHFFSKHGFGDTCDFLYFEYASGGEHIMNVQFQDIKQVFSVIAQVAFTIAVAEAAIEFEHRHLELDAIMVASTRDKHVEFRLNSRGIWLPTCGVTTRITNIGKARARVDGSTYYSDLARRFSDPVFADGATWFGYGFALGALHSGWSQYNPLTNVMYLAQMLGDLVFNLEFEDEFDQDTMRPLLDLRYALLTTKYTSMVSVVENCLEFKSILP